MTAINDVLTWINSYLWGPPMLILLFGTHLYFTIRLRGIQRYTGLAVKLSITKDPLCRGDVSQFGALTTALAATVGTGNIVGVATAVALGGPGALLWVWLTGVFGIATKYAEALLAVKFRTHTDDGGVLGGPMCTIERGLGMKWLAVLFAIFTAIAAFGIGNMVQAHSITDLAQSTVGVQPYVLGLIMAAIVALVILGGVRSIARVSEFLAPIMAIVYVIGCLVILGHNISAIPASLLLIFKSAFTGKAAAGGFAGSAILLAARYGVARGLFSNESGLGSAPIIAAAAQTRNAVRQGLVSSTGTFWDTVIICAITGLVLVNTGVWQSGHEGAAMTNAAFHTMPVVGPLVLTFGLFTFTFSTILGWSYYGERAMEYLFGKRAITPYRVAWVGAVFLGAVSTMEVVWNFADTANALMAIPNLVSLLLLSGIVIKETRTYLWSGKIDEVDSDLAEDPAEPTRKIINGE
ncbi:MAG TPA: sodium:alanine symporter family protein [Armatimonadota bacterium]|nr:sodium:alanine symporter family protein [Armatimonadota bacterium]